MAILARTIYLADDNPALRQGLYLALRTRGYAVRTAADGEGVLALLESGRPDLMLLDVMMPGMSGLEVLARIRADRRWSDIPVFLLTAAAGAELRGETVPRENNLQVLSKPVRLAELVRRIEGCLSE